MPDSQFGDAPVGPVHPCSAAPEHWIEIQLRDEEDQPVANEEYLVQLTDGQEVRGYLDANGFARFDLRDAGNCKVRFPNIDADAWKED